MPSAPDEEKQDSATSADADLSNDIVRALGKSGIVLFAGVFLELFISFVSKLIVANVLTRPSYGEVAVGLTVLTLLAIVSRLGLDTGVARMAPRYDGQDRYDVYLSAYLVLAISTLVLAGTLYVTAGTLASLLGNRNLGPVLRIIAVGVPAYPVMKLSIGVVRAEGRSGPKVIVQNITHPLVRIGLVAAIALLGASPTRIAAAYVASNWLTGLLALGFADRYTNLLGRVRVSRLRVMELVRFSTPLMLSAGMIFVVGETDNIIIQYFIDSGAVGAYDIAYTVGQILTAALGAFGFLFLPQVSSLHSDGMWDEIHRLYRLVSKWIVFITLPGFLLMVLFPDVVIRYTFGAKYLAGTEVLQVIAATYFFRAVMGPNRGLLAAIGATEYILYANVTVAVLNLTLNIVLVPIMGIIGAAVASFASFALLNTLYVYKLWNDHGIVPASRQMLLPTGVFSLIAGTTIVVLRSVVGVTRNPALLIAISTVLAGAYAFCIFALGGIQSEDVMLINSAEEQFGVDLERIKALIRRVM